MARLALPFAAVVALALAVGCADIPTGPEVEPEWDETFVLSDYLPRQADLPDGLVLADRTLSPVAGAPQNYSKGSVERYSSQWGWGIFTRISERPFVGAGGGRDDRNFEEPRAVVYIYRRRPGYWQQTETVVTVEGGREDIHRKMGPYRGELEMAVYLRHAYAKNLVVTGSPHFVVAVIQDGRDDQIVASGFDWLADWMRTRIEGIDY